MMEVTNSKHCCVCLYICTYEIYIHMCLNTFKYIHRLEGDRWGVFGEIMGVNNFVII